MEWSGPRCHNEIPNGWLSEIEYAIVSSWELRDKIDVDPQY
jgi:hypothetical protein